MKETWKISGIEYWLMVLSIWGLGIRMVHGAEAHPGTVNRVPCAVLTKFDGEVQILDSTRTHLVDTGLKAGVPCGGWISTQRGTAELTHRQGFVIKMGERSFVEVFDNEADKHLTGEDHMILYKGKVYVQAQSGMGGLRVVTPNGRLRVDHGIGVLIFDQQSEETQVIALEGKIEIENRFENKIRIPVQPGEASSLNLKTFRVLPETPNPLQITELRKLLGDVPLEVKEMQVAVRAVRNRNERKFAAPLDGTERSPASEAMRRGSYARHSESARDPEIEKKFMKKLVGGADSGAKLLFPGGRHPAAAASTHDSVHKVEEEHHRKMSDEKKRVMEALSEVEY